MGCHFLLQGIFPTQGLNPGLLHCRQMLNHLSHQGSDPYMTTEKHIALTRWTFVGKVISLLFNMLSRLVITFLPRSKCLLISCLKSPSAVLLEPPKNKVCHCFHCFPIYFPWHGILKWGAISYSRGWHFLLRGSSRAKGLNPSLLHLLHQQMDSLPLVPPGKSKTWKRKEEEIKRKSTIRKQG